MDNETGSESSSEQNTIQEVVYDSPINPYSDIVGAILTIPATLIILAFFSCIYKIFINRRTRG